MTKEKDYEVGYKKPPVATRWQKGQSGNPRGRKKKKKPEELDPGKILQSIDNEEIIVPIDGKRKRITKAETQFRQLFTIAIKGKLAAARLIVKMASEHAFQEGGSYGLEAIGETEAAKRFGRNWHRRVQEHNANLGDWR